MYSCLCSICIPVCMCVARDCVCCSSIEVECWIALAILVEYTHHTVANWSEYASERVAYVNILLV
jgi:hypothetical protein